MALLYLLLWFLTAKKLKLCNDKAGYITFDMKFMDEILNFLNSNKNK
jgi:hypothetical protein